MNRVRFWNLVSTLIMLAGAILFGCMVWIHGGVTFSAFIGTIMFGAGLLVGWIKVRCPFCRRFLGLAAAGRFCPHCGGEIGK